MSGPTCRATHSSQDECALFGEDHEGDHRDAHDVGVGAAHSDDVGETTEVDKGDAELGPADADEASVASEEYVDGLEKI